MVYVAALAIMVVLRFILREYTEKNKKLFTAISCLLLVFVASCRDFTVGTDTLSFANVFVQVAPLGIKGAINFNSWTEPGFRVLCALIGYFTQDPRWLIVVTSMIIHIGVSVFIYRHSKNVYLSFLLYMMLMLYPYYLNIMRQAIAISVWLIAYDFLKKKRYVWYCLLVLLAMSFHFSAALFLVCPFLALIPVNRKTLSIFLPAFTVFSLASVVFAKPLLKVLQGIFSKYEDYTVTTFDALYYYLAVFVIFTLYGVIRLYFTRPAGDPSGENAPPVAKAAAGFDERGFFAMMMLIGCVFAALMTQYGIVERIFNYFEILYLVWIPLFLPPSAVGEKKRLGYRPETLAVGACCLAYFVVILFSRSEQWYAALPYSFFWQA